jgi:hypothetical protein
MHDPGTAPTTPQMETASAAASSVAPPKEIATPAPPRPSAAATAGHPIAIAATAAPSVRPITAAPPGGAANVTAAQQSGLDRPLLIDVGVALALVALLALAVIWIARRRYSDPLVR